MSQKVTIIILNWNGKKYLEQFLPSVMQTRYDNFHVLVADNGSTDDSVEFLKEHYPAVEVAELKENWGFTTGNNKALAFVKSDFYVLLNSDVEVDPDWLAPMMGLMESDANIAAIQPRIRAFHDKDSFEYAGAAGGYLDVFGYPFCRGRIFDVLEKDENQYNTASEIFWATGACMLIRKAVSDKIGLFEDRFFAHMEEIDFCWRARNHGHTIMYCPDSIVYHVGGGTLSRQNPRKTVLNLRNSLAMIMMNFPRWQMPFKVYARLCLDGVWGAVSLLKGDWQNIPAIFKAHWTFFFQIPYWLKRRKARYKGLNKFHALEKPGYYKGSIVWKHWVAGLKKFSELNLPSAKKN